MIVVQEVQLHGLSEESITNDCINIASYLLKR